LRLNRKKCYLEGFRGLSLGFSQSKMEATLHALGQLLLQALPTFFLVCFLYLYLSAVFFKPLSKVLEERRDATEGARKAAAESLERADQKIAAYEQSLRHARNELYQEQEVIRGQWRAEQANQLKAAKARLDEQVKAAKADIAGQAAVAKQSLAGNSASLATQIADSVLRRAS